MKTPQAKKDATPKVAQKKISSFFTPRASPAGPGLKATAAIPAEAEASHDHEKENKKASRSPAKPGAAVSGAADVKGGKTGAKATSSAAKPSTSTKPSSTTAKPSPARAARPASATLAKPSPARSGGKKTATAKPQGPSQDPTLAARGIEVVGCRVRVYWPLDKAWYSGTVTKWDGTAKHYVVYDDNETEWVDFAKEQVEILGVGTAANGGVAVKKAGHKRASVFVSDDDEDGSGGAGTGTASKAAKGRKQVARRRLAATEDSDSEWDGEGEVDASGDDVSVVNSELEDELEDEVPSTGTKRKRRATQGPGRHRLDGHHPPAQVTPPARKKPPGAAGGTTPAAVWSSQGTPFAVSGRQAAQAPTPGSASLATPQTGGREGLHRALDVTPVAPSGRKDSVGTPSTVTHGVDVVTSGEAERFLGGMATRFPFLAPENIRDGARRRPDDPLYDPSTLFIPEDWYKKNKVADGQRQWWGFKAGHFDAVLLFKMGKFYEMFEMDAMVGCDVLGLSFMKGERPHAGFPEIRYHDMAEKLARAGYKVVVVEQVETPEGLRLRNEERKRKGLKTDGVVAREKVAVLSCGTLIDAEMVSTTPDAAYVMAVFEVEGGDPAAHKLKSDVAPMDVTCNTMALDAPASGSTGSCGCGEGAPSVVTIGLCVADVASGQVLVGQFYDDEVRSSLRTHLTALQPVEVVLPRAPLSSTTMRVLQACLRSPRLNVLRGELGDWTAAKAVQQLEEGGYFGEGAAGHAVGGAWPQALAHLAAAARVADGSDPAAAVAAGAAMASTCGMVSFLKESLLDRAVFPLGRVELLAELHHAASTAGAPLDGAAGSAPPERQELTGPTTMLLNGAALENLEVLENSEGGVRGTLLAVLDHCSTPFGRRRLRQWLCRPLFRVADIVRRQDAVADLSSGALVDAVGKARKHLSGVSDLERAVARLYASTVAGAMGRDAAHVVLYEDAAKRRVHALLSAVKDLQAVARAVGELQAASEHMTSELLQQLTAPGGRWAEVTVEAEALSDAADWTEAKSSGRVIPAKGVNAAFDEACKDVADVELQLQDYLKQIRQKLGGAASIKFVSVSKDSHLVEVPDSVRVPGSFDLKHQRSGFKRYSTAELAELVEGLGTAQERKEAASATILQGIINRFVEHQGLWLWAVECVAQLDALMSLASHALDSCGAMCRPNFVVPGAEGGCFEAKGLRHPGGLPGRDGSFVPNDITLGGSTGRPFLMLTGPNMGGKSTLLRQVCLATVMAQVGACVPAESLTLSAADAVFVRMGARDHILTGQSTFFVELFETGAMLNRATGRSLAVLDELGRGTATLDGAAIAAAVLQHLASSTRCLGLFATHYHHLADQYANDPRIAIMHMGCALDMEGQEGPSSSAGSDKVETAKVQAVTFLYKLTGGACPRSYGTNVAQLAGLPASVVQRAAEISAAREATSHVGRDTTCGAGGGMATAGAVTAQGNGLMDVDVQAAAGPTNGPSGGLQEAAVFKALAAIVAEVRGKVQVGEADNVGLQRLQQQAQAVLAAH